jgi:hypothetical protein
METQARVQSSKHDLANQALQAALELERAIAGISPNLRKITELAVELRAKAEPLPDPGPFKLLEPGYLGTLCNVVRHYDKSIETVDAVQARVIEFAGELDQFASHRGGGGEAAKLRDICLSLHTELLQDLLSEEAPANDWQSDLYYAPAGVGPT